MGNPRTRRCSRRACPADAYPSSARRHNRQLRRSSTQLKQRRRGQPGRPAGRDRYLPSGSKNQDLQTERAVPHAPDPLLATRGNLERGSPAARFVLWHLGCQLKPPQRQHISARAGTVGDDLIFADDPLARQKLLPEWRAGLWRNPWQSFIIVLCVRSRCTQLAGMGSGRWRRCMLVFPSPEWVAAWVELANSDQAFRSAGAGLGWCGRRRDRGR